MKKIINGKVYDTSTAQKVTSFSSNRPQSDFGYYSESLYRKRTGEFFLSGEGGAMSKYAVSHGNNEWGWGEKIIPLSYEAAKKWVEQNCDAEEYEKIFGLSEPEDPNEKTKMTFYISVGKADRLRKAAEHAETSISAYLETLIP